MPFITQGSIPNCGAFCLCYLEWLEEGRTPDGTRRSDDQNRVDEVYEYVKVDDGAATVLPAGYCNPVEMISYLQSSRDVRFYIADDSAMKGVLAAMESPGSRQRAFISTMREQGTLIEKTPPLPGAGSAAIAVYNVNSGGGKQEQHYILFRWDKTDVLRRYNPWDGEATEAHGYDSFESNGSVMTPAGAAILIHPREKAK